MSVSEGFSSAVSFGKGEESRDDYYKRVTVNRAKLIRKGNLLLQPWTEQWGRDYFLMDLHHLKCERCDLVEISVPKESLVTCKKCGFEVFCELCFEYTHAGGYFQTHEKGKVGVYGVKSMENEEEQDGMSDGTVQGETHREFGDRQLIDSNSAGTWCHDVRSRDDAAVEGSGPGGASATKLREPLYVGDEEDCGGTSESSDYMGYFCTVVDDDTGNYSGGGDDNDSDSDSDSGDGDDGVGDIDGSSFGGVSNGGRGPRFRTTLVWPGDHRFVGESAEGQRDIVSGDGGLRFRTTLVASGVANGGRGPRFRTTRTTLVWPGGHGHVPACDEDQP